ncbi:MAG: signal peptidase I [Planctomycetota bacterium]|nr:signal peptidase I [Planctomycetota bacterium]
MAEDEPPNAPGLTENLQDQAAKPEEESHFNSSFLLWLCVTLFLIIIVHAFVIEVYVVVGDSMDPTLQDREHLLVNKMATNVGGIKRYDILVFRHPDAGKKHLIKRVIAFPGEKIRMTAGRVYILEKEGEKEYPLPEKYLSDLQRSANLNEMEYTVPKGCFYVLGDNRHNSRDSRSFGGVQKADVVGEALMVIWPFKNLKGL